MPSCTSPPCQTYVNRPSPPPPPSHTQVPQYLLEAEITAGRGGACSIICTQPRRIAALGLAGRVAQERGEGVGQVVGYSVRLESKVSARTRLLYCTTGGWPGWLARVYAVV
jgi:HrpA-like RNA helicase